MAETSGEILVTAVDRIDVAQNGSARSGKHTDENHDGWAESLRSDELGWVPVGRAFDIDAVSVEELDFDIEVGKLGGVDGAIFKNPVVDKSAASGNGGDDGEKWEIVYIKTWEGHRMDFVDRGVELGFFDGEIDETSAVVHGTIFASFVNLGAHGFENFELDFEKFDRSAKNGDFGIGDESGGDEAHGLDGVFGKEIFDVFVDFGTAANGQSGGADAGDFDAEFFEKEAEVLDHVIWRSADDGGLAWRESGGHEDVFGDSIATFGKDDVTIGVFMQSFFADGDFIKAAIALCIDIKTERFESLDVRLYRACAERTAASVWNVELFVAMEKWAEEHNDGTGPSCSVDIHFVEF